MPQGSPGTPADPTQSDPRRRPLPWRRRLAAMALLPAAFAFQALVSTQPAWVEANYSRGVYPYLAAGLELLFGWVPVSVAELAIALLAIWVFARTFLALSAVIAGTRDALDALLHGLTWLLAFAGWVALAFVVLWGPNYYRQPLAVQAGWDTLDESTITVEELEALAVELAEEANRLRAELPEDGAGVFALADGKRSALLRASSGLMRAREKHDWLGGPIARPKAALLSPVLSRLWITGIYSPVTGEPHVNQDATDPEIPFTALHEMAHALGYAREDEANFIAYLACREHPDADYRYSGVLEGLMPVLNALAGQSETERMLREGRHAGIGRDLAAIAANWARVRSKVTTISRKVNDVYLKSQGQSAGVASYGLVLRLLVAERRARGATGSEGAQQDGVQPKPEGEASVPAGSPPGESNADDR